MSARPQAWLPDSALHDGTVTALLSQAATSWSERWFAHQRPLLLRACASHEPDLIEDGLRWVSDPDGLVLTLDAQKVQSLGASVLGLKPGAVRPTDADKALLRKLASAAALDLANACARALGFEAQWTTSAEMAAPSGATLRYSLHLGLAKQAFELEISRQAAIAARRGALPTTLTTPTAHARAEAVARQSIEVGALLGGARLSFSELRTLSVGDVVPLDDEDMEHLSLTIDRVPRMQARCALRQDGDRLFLQVTSLDQAGVNDHA